MIAGEAMETSEPLTAIGISASAVLLGTLIYRWLGRPSRSFGPTPLLSHLASDEMQSRQLPDGSRAWLFTENDELLDSCYDGTKTLYEVFQRGLRLSENGPCLGTRKGDGPYEWMSYKEVDEDARAIGSTLKRKFGLERGAFLSIYAKNRREWILVEQACNRFTFVLVPLYDTLGPDACEYVLNQTEAAVIVVDDEDKLVGLLNSGKKFANLRGAILMTVECADSTRQAAHQAGVDLLTWPQALEFGRKNRQTIDPPKPDDLATLCYTSGTTGKPKGCMLSHRNVVSDAQTAFHAFRFPAVGNSQLKTIAKLSNEDVYLSYLPLAHMFERVAIAMCFTVGLRVGFSRGDVRLLMDDMQALRPTLFCTVPRLLNRIYDRVQAGVAGSFLKRQLLQLAIRRKTQMLESGVIRNDTLWDRLVFKRVHQLTGGRIRIVVTGSAPIGGQVMQFVRAAFGCPVFEGYGQTEATAAITVTMAGETELGHVGAPIPCNLVKLVDVPEMNYLAANNQGEICIKGANVFLGYYKEPEKTKEVIDADGWVHTGDIGEWTPRGCLRVVDRRKHLFKLAQGEYVAPEKIEQLLSRSQFVAQIFVDGHSLEVCVLAVVVPDAEVVLPWARERDLPTDLEQLCRSRQFKQAVLEDLETIGREGGLKGFEIVKDVHLHAEPFSIDNGLLTPTFKSKRPDLRAKFHDQFVAMYNGLR